MQSFFLAMPVPFSASLTGKGSLTHWSSIHRKGCDANFIDQTLSFRPRRIVYVSCDPATQARDAKLLLQGGYRILQMQPFDLFPQTRHIENVLTLEI